jgi:outer membrane lipoprotein SlyB
MRNLITLRSALLVSASVCLFGCQAPGANLQGNVYKAGQVNTTQDVKMVKIMAVLPAQVEADNSQQKKGAEVIGGILGAVGGGVAGNHIAGGGSKTAGTAVGAVGGGAGGALLGSLVSDTTLVQGVTLTYKLDGKLKSSTQVGQPCEYAVGMDAAIISTSPTETRIQPNTTCPSAPDSNSAQS